ncbi:hypothetical protein MTBLM1_60249 [Rhodospirillaceae bacterium LM-1]|nr:hypothetical protein MTBLM1_60249 [Rhodospirillaceae bacterium LM-1]
MPVFVDDLLRVLEGVKPAPSKKYWPYKDRGQELYNKWKANKLCAK